MQRLVGLVVVVIMAMELSLKMRAEFFADHRAAKAVSSRIPVDMFGWFAPIS